MKQDVSLFLITCVYKIDMPPASLPFLPRFPLGSGRLVWCYPLTWNCWHWVAGAWGWHSRIATQLRFIRSYSLPHQHADPMPRVYFGKNMYLTPAKLSPTLISTWHTGTPGLFALTSRRIFSVNISRPNSDFSKNKKKKKGWEDIGTGNTMRDKNDIDAQKSHCHKLPG